MKVIYAPLHNSYGILFSSNSIIQILMVGQESMVSSFRCLQIHRESKDGRTPQGLGWAKTSAPSKIILTNDPQHNNTLSSSCFVFCFFFPFWKSRKFLFLRLRSTKTAVIPIRKGCRLFVSNGIQNHQPRDLFSKLVSMWPTRWRQKSNFLLK